METWNFHLRLNRIPTDDEIDALYDAGLDDAAISGATIDVDREAADLLEAITSALVQIRAVPGLYAVGLLDDDAVTLTDAAQRLDGVRTAESLRLLANGTRGMGGFPEPLVDTGKIRVYSFIAILRYLRTLGDPVKEPDPDRALYDRALRLRAEAVRAGRADAVERLLASA
jgi:hypothetical protein